MYQKKVLWIGFHEEGEIAFKKLTELNVNIVGVITLTKDELVKKSGAFDYRQFCEQSKIPIYEVTNINNDYAIGIIKNIMPEITFVIGWSQILEDYTLDALGLTIGAHASYLPKNRGSAPVNWAIINGEEESGNTLMVLAADVDTGDILYQEKYPISLYDSCKTIYQKVASANAKMILSTINDFESNEMRKVKQNINDDTLLPRRKPADGVIDWNQTSLKVYNFIRALTYPYPGATTILNDIKIIIWVASYNKDKPYDNSNNNGNVIGVVYSFIPELCGVVIQCGVGVVTCHKIEVFNTGELLVGERMINLFIEKT